MSGLETDVLDRSAYGNRETSALRLVTHETNPMAFEKQLEGTRVLTKANPNTPVPSSPPQMVAGGGQCVTGPTIAPLEAYATNIHRHIQGGLGAHLN